MLGHRILILLSLLGSGVLIGNAQAQARIQSMTITPAELQLQFEGATNHVYEIEQTANITNLNWTILDLEEIISAGNSTLSPALPVAGQAYYRMKELPYDPSLAIFENPTNGFRAISIYDALGDIIQVDADLNALIWAETGMRYFQGAFPVIDELFLAGDKRFQIRFGSVDGQRRAYITDASDATIYNLRIFNGVMQIFSTTFTVPHT